jgi:hypothetical protein
MSLIMCSLRLLNSISKIVAWIMNPCPSPKKVSYYLLSDDFDSDEADEMDRVPENSIFIQEWEKDGVKRCVLFYEGEEIDRDGPDPFDLEPVVPWLWIGDRKTEVDLTSAMQKYMVAGNTIRLDLILHMIQVHYDTEIVYVDARTMEEVKFPAQGVEILAKYDPPSE